MTDSTNSATSPEAPIMAPASAWEPSSKLSPRKRRRRIRLAIVSLLVAGYALGTWYFSSHFTPNTYVDGIDAGLMTVDELTSALQTRVSSYTQHLKDANGFDATLSVGDIGLTSDCGAIASEAFTRTTPALWPLSSLSTQSMLIDGDNKVDEASLDKAVRAAVAAYNETAEPPTNAEAHYDEKSKKFVISHEAVGTMVDAEKIVDECVVASRELRSEVPLGDEVLAQPELTDTDERLVTAADKANETLSKDLDIKFGDKTVATITPELKAPWLYLDDNLELSVDGESVWKWMESNESLNTAGRWTDDVHVYELDALGTADATYQAIRDAKDSVEMALTLLETKPDVTPGAKERGRHIDVNLSTQFARFYDTDGTVIWDSYFVSGNVLEGRSTPTGDFAIEAKETNRTLVGADENKDGKPDYESFVYYWMPFLAGDWGLHDATWRYDSEFGGDTYYWGGSHGCVNLPYAKAEELYNLCVVGDPVIVHW